MADIVKEEEIKGHTYNATRIAGNGSFGVVYEAVESGTNETVAIKKVFQDKRYKNREVQIMKILSHPNIIHLKHHFYTKGDKEDEIFLNIVMDYFPETAYKILKQYQKDKQPLPLILIKLFSYQLMRALAYIHILGICHRDIKPQNLLINPSNSALYLCDFGSAKTLLKGESNIAYISSRWYRAPELIFGSTNYNFKIDVWAAGCVVAELLLGKPLFPGDSGVDQMVEIIKLLGTPTRDELRDMNPDYNEFKFPFVKSNPWSKVFEEVDKDAVEFVASLLKYSPNNRPGALESLLHPFFNELKDRFTAPTSEKSMPNLFDWTDEEVQFHPPEVLRRISSV